MNNYLYKTHAVFIKTNGALFCGMAQNGFSLGGEIRIRERELRCLCIRHSDQAQEAVWVSHCGGVRCLAACLAEMRWRILKHRLCQSHG